MNPDPHPPAVPPRQAIAKAVCLGLIGLLALTGCAHHYVMRLNNGAEITTASKPQLVEDTYRFKDARGQEHFVSAGRVREITPASMARRESNLPAIKEKKPKQRKWYRLWLW